nr:PREDICTED: neuromedin-S isoform X3 [Paralichthys olivaceus]
MTLPTVRQLFLLCLFWFLGCWSSTDASPYDPWEDGIAFREVRGIQGDDLKDVLWRDQDEHVTLSELYSKSLTQFTLCCDFHRNFPRGERFYF